MISIFRGFCVHIVYITNNCKKLTACAHLGKYHFELTKRCVTKTPSTTCRSTTSVPIIDGVIGFGYFRHAACATVSHGWLQKLKKLFIISLKIHMKINISLLIIKKRNFWIINYTLITSMKNTQCLKYNVRTWINNKLVLRENVIFKIQFTVFIVTIRYNNIKFTFNQYQ